MTMTESRPEAQASTPASPATAAVYAPPTGVAGWIMTADHKKVGRLFVVTALVLAVGALAAGVLAGIERIDPTGASLFDRTTDGDQAAHLFVFAVPFLAVIPLLLGLAVYAVPLQVGARTLAFPRAASLAYFGWLTGAVLVVASFLANGGPSGGRSDAVDLFLGGMVVVVASLLLSAVCVATTVLTLRSPGMSLDRVPFFSWASLVSATGLLLSLPVMIGHLVLLFADHKYGTREAFGGNDQIASYLTWAVTQPQTLLYAMPILGIVADIVPVFARVRGRMGSVLFVAIGAAGFLGIGADIQQVIDPKVTTEPVFVIASVAGIVPVLLVLAVAGLHLAKLGKPDPKAPLVLAMPALLLLLAGVVAGALYSIKGLELGGTAFATGQTDLVLLGGGLLGGLAGVAFWGPKMWGRKLPETQVKGLAPLALLAVALSAVTTIVLGWAGDQPFLATAFEGDRGYTKALNALDTVGLALLAVVVAGFVALAVRAFTQTGELVDADPWHGHTLEWATSSPPPEANFGVELPAVRSAQPLLDLREEA
ncbi:MAG: cbb3-type cytochrome c oxidase subunit I [Acidimicrobiia bacterium]